MLITFEGLDGSGKSTQIARLCTQIERLGRRAVVLREPGGTPVSERIRAVLLDVTEDIDPVAEMLLFSAARAQLVAHRIRPLLARGSIVICDRFYDSTTAYQGGGRGLADVGWLHEFHRMVTGGLEPDRTYLLAVDPAVAASRRAGRQDRMERSGEAFFARVAEAYAALARREPGRFLVVDGSGDPDAIAASIWADLEPRVTGTGMVGPGTRMKPPAGDHG